MQEIKPQSKVEMEILNLGSFGLKLCYIAVLFIAFLIICLIPSVNKYLEAGVIIERRSVVRKHNDTPAITFCVLNEGPFGWKNVSKKLNLNKSWVDVYCDNHSSTVDDALQCLDDQTYNLTETINSYPSRGHDFFLDMEQQMWNSDASSSYEGTLVTINK